MRNLTRWYPFDALTDLHHQRAPIFGRSWIELSREKSWSWVPTAEVAADKDGWNVQMELPGLDPSDVHVELNHNVLTVKGERSLRNKTEDRYLSEISYGEFERRFTVPDNVDTEKVAAHFEHGMLELRLPVKELSTRHPRRIEVGIKTPDRAA